VGAICGAIPPMMGWTAATGRVAYGAWVLGAILFVWQIPHFLALAWLYRIDYERGGFRMLPVLDRSGSLTSQVALVYTVALVPIGLAITLAGLAGTVFLVGSFLLGLGMLAQGIRLHLRRTDANARLLFVASLVYLTVFLILLVGNRGPIDLR
jgi:heme O synthase-like polyprenyltransferase